MGKQAQDLIKVKRGTEERVFSADQWRYMKSTGSTYGWEQVLEVPQEIQQLQAKAEVSQEAAPEEQIQEPAPAEKPKRRNQWSK